VLQRHRLKSAQPEYMLDLRKPAEAGFLGCFELSPLSAGGYQYAVTADIGKVTKPPSVVPPEQLTVTPSVEQSMS
jgi:hypothetical protein